MTCTSCNGTGLDGGEPCQGCNGTLVAPCWWDHGAEADRMAPTREHEDASVVMRPMCDECASTFERGQARRQRQDDAEARGDWLRDMAKDDELEARR